MNKLFKKKNEILKDIFRIKYDLLNLVVIYNSY